MVSNAYISQAIQGVNFPATREQLLELVDEKLDLAESGMGTLSTEQLMPIYEALESMEEGARFVNMPHVWEEVGSILEGIRRTTVAFGSPAMNAPVEREDAPLGTGRVQPDMEAAGRAMDVHENIRERIQQRRERASERADEEERARRRRRE